MIAFSVLFTMAHKVEQYTHYFKTIRIFYIKSKVGMQYDLHTIYFKYTILVLVTIILQAR